MHFENEKIMLIALALAGAIFILWLRYILRRKRKLSAFAEPQFFQLLFKHSAPRFTNFRALLLVFAVVLAAIALGRPQWGGEAKLVKARGVEVILSLDISRSMLARDIKPDRFTRAKLELGEFIDRLKGNKVGIVVFAGTSFVQCPLTVDTAAAKLFLKAVSVGSISETGTAISDALQTSRLALHSSTANMQERAESFGRRAVVLLTDGEDHQGNIDAELAKYKKEGITVFTVGIGNPEGEPIPVVDEEGRVLSYHKDSKGEVVLSKLDEEILKKIANETGGMYIRASDSGVGLSVILEAIQSMETREFEDRISRVYDEGFQYFLVAALAALIIALALPKSKSLT